MSHHVLFILEMRKFSWITVSGIIFSLLMFYPVNVALNDNIFISPYYNNQFNFIYTSVLFHLTTAVQVVILCLPRIIWVVIDQTYWHPEFVKIKGR